MKKLLLMILMAIMPLVSFAQDTFVRKYTYFYTKKNGVIDEGQNGHVTVVFNDNNTTNIVMYYSDVTKILYRVKELEIGYTSNNKKYQYVECIDDEGTTIGLQLFDETSTLRLFFKGNNYLEFHE